MNALFQLLLFPEGTDKCPIATARSRQFADKNDLVQYNYVVHPRTTGFVYLLQKMRESLFNFNNNLVIVCIYLTVLFKSIISANYVDYIYDVTCAYSDAIVQSEVDLVTLGLTPKEIHFDIRKISVTNLPETDEGLDEWIKELWAQKEERLRQYYTKLRKDRNHRLDTLPGATKDFVV